jgi:hypothetical protein
MFCRGVKLGLSSIHRSTLFENRVVRRIFGLKRKKVQGVGEDCIARSFITCMHQQKLLE